MMCKMSRFTIASLTLKPPKASFKNKKKQFFLIFKKFVDQDSMILRAWCKDRSQKILLYLGTNSFKRNMHGILPHLVVTSPQKLNFVSKIAIYPVSKHFLQPPRATMSNLN